MTCREAEKILLQSGIEDARNEAAVLVSEYCAVPLHELVFRRDENFIFPALDAAVARRAKREPLQYILGAWNFHGLRFELNRDCLCPREDTELIVDTAAKLVPRDTRFLDIGTGSGAIAVALLHMRPDLTALALDISDGALEAAAKNAAANGVGGRIEFCRCDALDTAAMGATGSFDCVISNPPYIKTKDLVSPAPELEYEPIRALDGGEDGMLFYRAILSVPGLLKRGGSFIFEIGYDEGPAIRRLASEHGYLCQVLKDLGGNDRCAVLTGNEETLSKALS